MARFFSSNHNSLLRIATNEIASFQKDQRSRQMAFFRAKAGQRRGQGRGRILLKFSYMHHPKAGFRIKLKYFEIKKAFRYYKTNRFHVGVRLIQ